MVQPEVSHTGLSFPLSTDGCLAAGKGSFDGGGGGAWEWCQGPDLWAFESRLKGLQGQLCAKEEPPSLQNAPSFH